MTHLILGAGRFSHAHIRVLGELGIGQVGLCRKTAWTAEAMYDFKHRHPSMSIAFHAVDEPDLFAGRIVHIVTPGDQHLSNMIESHKSAGTIFVEKPAVLLDDEHSFSAARYLRYGGGPRIYQNDWLAGLVSYRRADDRPRRVVFEYDVADLAPGIDPLSEIASHACNLIGMWASPGGGIEVMEHETGDDHLRISAVFDGDMHADIGITWGRISRSRWRCSIDSEEFSNESHGGTLLLDAFRRVTRGDDPITDWYDSSWLIYKLRTHEDADVYAGMFSKWYGE